MCVKTCHSLLVVQARRSLRRCGCWTLTRRRASGVWCCRGRVTWSMTSPTEGITCLCCCATPSAQTPSCSSPPWQIPAPPRSGPALTPLPWHPHASPYSSLRALSDADTIIMADGSKLHLLGTSMPAQLTAWVLSGVSISWLM